MYADDTSVLLIADNDDELNNRLNCTLDYMTDWFSANGLALNMEKTNIINLIFVVPCIMLNSEIIPTRCNNCVYSSQWLYSICFG